TIVGGFLSPVLEVFVYQVFATEVARPVATLISLLVTVTLICLVGVTGTLFSQRIFQRTETVFTRIPLVRGIYRSVRQLTDLFVGKDASFQNVALIEYPRKGLRSLCFITSRHRLEIPGRSSPAVCVFLPTTPNPTSGFFILVPEDEVIPLSISVDEAVKMIMSGGIIAPADGELHAIEPSEPVDLPREEIKR
ncbi:MAG: DUF502 domain-containing protein, partial [Candidatus Methylomirabilales bacterium]